jgi:hypothetical protein
MSNGGEMMKEYLIAVAQSIKHHEILRRSRTQGIRLLNF